LQTSSQNRDYQPPRDAGAPVKDGDLRRITWVDIEQALTEDWAIGGSAIT